MAEVVNLFFNLPEIAQVFDLMDQLQIDRKKTPATAPQQEGPRPGLRLQALPQNPLRKIQR